MASRPAITENEWICGGSRCQQVNNGSNTCCEFCGRSKPRGKGQVGHEIGKEAAEKSKGLFAAEDWSCSKCGNINWARRLQCNICNAAKCGEVEARTGYGGGYMDRQQVERRRNVSDDEYDHFGRRKKKANNESAVRKSVRDESPSSDRSNGKVELDDRGDDDDDDEDDDDSDSDLAKYDLVDFADQPVNETAERKTAGNSSSGEVDTEKSKKKGSCSVSDDTSSSELSSASTEGANSASSHSSPTKRCRHRKRSSSVSSRSSRDGSSTGSSRRSSPSAGSRRSHLRSSTSDSRSRSSGSRASSPVEKRRRR